MVRRSSSAFFSHFSTDDSRAPSLPVTPVSPLFADPFGASINLPEPIGRSSTYSANSTPQILIASPSTSTIHYLFPSHERSGTYLTVGREDKLARSDSSASTTSNNSTGSTGSTKLKQRSRVRTEGFHLPTMSGSMRTLRRQPSMADLGGNKRNLRLVTKPLVELSENIERGRTESEKTKLTPADISAPIPQTSKSARRRSQSLSSPRPAPSPPPAMPQLPHPDLGAPLTARAIVQSPSYSHLDYAPAPSPSRSRHSRGWSVHSKATYPVSAAMVREVRDVAEREGGGRYPVPIATNPREEAIRRLSGVSTTSEAYAYHSSTRDRRRRSQSVGSKSGSARWNITDPLPWAPDLSYQARKRRESSAYSPTWSDPDSPYPPSSGGGYFRAAQIGAITSDISLLAPSTVGLGFSPVSSPGSLPRSLEEQAIDLTLPTRPLASPQVVISPAPDLPRSPPTLRPGALSPPAEIHRSRRSLIRENTYYLPGQPRPLRIIRSTESLPRSSSLSPTTPQLITPDFSPVASSDTSPREASGISRSLSARFKFPSPSNSFKTDFSSHTALSRHLPSSPPSIGNPIPSEKSRKPLKASSSIRGLGNRISRSLSTVFDTRDHAKLEAIRLREEEIKSRISSPLEAGRSDKEFREGLLYKVVSTSIGSKLSEYTQNSLESTKTRAIPQVLLDSAPIVEKERPAPKYSSLRGLRRSIRRRQEDIPEVDEQASHSPDSYVHVLPPSPAASVRAGSVRSGSVYNPQDQSVESESPQISRWSPSPPKRKLRLLGRAGSPPPATLKDRVASDPLPSRDEPSPIPPRSLSRGRLFFKSPSPPLPTFAPEGVSSSDMIITAPQPLLEKLSSLPSSQSTPEERHRSLKAWRDDVRENGEILRLEGQILKHVEREREKMREITGASSVAPGAGVGRSRSRYGGMI